LVTLSTGQPGLRSALPVSASTAPALPPAPGAPPALPLLDFVASDATLDRAREIISPDGWRLENFRRNPVFQNAHHYDNILFTLGRATEVDVRGGRLWLRVQFAAHINPLARMAYELYRGGFLRAVSVGFIPLRWENGNERTPWRRRFLEQELIEVSAVPVPANPNALALAAKAGAITFADVRALHELLEMTLRELPAALPATPAWARLAAATAQMLRAF
jgi:HK97 family phage prohead protease